MNSRTTSYIMWNQRNKFHLILMLIGLSIAGCNKEDEGHSVNDTGLCLVEMNGNFEEVELDESPLFLDGGQEGFERAILEEISYPSEARENGIEGLCLITYEITENGMVENIMTTQNPGGGIGESASTAVKTATAGISFSPGILNNVPIRVKKEIEIKYSL